MENKHMQGIKENQSEKIQNYFERDDQVEKRKGIDEDRKEGQ